MMHTNAEEPAVSVALRPCLARLVLAQKSCAKTFCGCKGFSAKNCSLCGFEPLKRPLAAESCDKMLAIVDYKAGNLTSVALALHEIGQQCVITDDKDTILAAERIIFPGVGSAGTAMQKLSDLGLDAVMRTAFAKGTPIMGLCLGTQIILSYSEEQSADCLDLIAGCTVRFPADMQGPDGRRLKIPQMGWNRIAVRKEHPVLAGVDHLDEFYFVHSYYPQPDDPAMVLATCEYGIEFPAAVGVKNLFAVQFHPEKSGRAGLRMLRNFCEWED